MDSDDDLLVLTAATAGPQVFQNQDLADGGGAGGGQPRGEAKAKAKGKAKGKAQPKAKAAAAAANNGRRKTAKGAKLDFGAGDEVDI
eukprot:1633769-Alexandrium_andersonii.AAC.1